MNKIENDCMKGFIPDPDYEGFNGVYVGDKSTIDSPPCNYDFSAACEYLRKNNRSFDDLTDEEINMFKLN